MTACGRFINTAKTSDRPVSAQAEADFFMEKYDEQADQEKTIICYVRQSWRSDLFQRLDDNNQTDLIKNLQMKPQKTEWNNQ